MPPPMPEVVAETAWERGLRHAKEVGDGADAASAPWMTLPNTVHRSLAIGWASLEYWRYDSYFFENGNA